jgi:hypothetical protein
VLSFQLPPPTGRAEDRVREVRRERWSEGRKGDTVIGEKREEEAGGTRM